MTVASGPIRVSRIGDAVQYKAATWELDVFHGAFEGLVVAELELDTEDQHIELPDWVGKEVTLDPNYLNSNLIEKV
jgi:CYTH domain-containing protein